MTNILSGSGVIIIPSFFLHLSHRIYLIRIIFCSFTAEVTQLKDLCVLDGWLWIVDFCLGLDNIHYNFRIFLIFLSIFKISKNQFTPFVPQPLMSDFSIYIYLTFIFTKNSSLEFFKAQQINQPSRTLLKL